MTNRNAIFDMSPTPATNDNVNGISLIENQTKPSDVNDIMRAQESHAKAYANDLAGQNTVGGTANAVTITLSSKPSSQASGLDISFIPSANNTTATTITVTPNGASAFTASTIRKISGGTDIALVGGELLAGALTRVVYSSTANSSAGAYIIVSSSGGVSVNADGGITLTSTDAGATAQPVLDLYRNSASPAANDILARTQYNGQNSTPAKKEYASTETVITSPTAGSESASMDDYVVVAGTRTRVFSRGPTPNTPSGFLDGYATTATAAGTTTLTVTSAKQQFFTGSTTQTVVLPVTSTLTLGQQYIITNSSTGAVTVQSSGANTVGVVAPGASATFTCILLSGTTAASWSAIAPGGPGAAKAWAYVTVSGGTPTLQASFNITGITDTGVGDLTITIATDFSSANYASLASVDGGTSATSTLRVTNSSATAVELRHYVSGLSDPTTWSWAGFGAQ